MRRPVQIILILLLLSSVIPECALAQREVSAGTGADTVSVQLYFRQGQSSLDMNYRGNRRSLESFVGRMRLIPKDTVSYDSNGRKRISSIRAINIFAGASPEGSSSFNAELSLRRAESIRRLLERNLPGYSDRFVVHAVGVDWAGLQRLAQSDPSLPQRDSVLHILSNVPEWVTEGGEVVDGRKRRLMNLGGGASWNYMSRHYFGELRGAGGKIYSEIETYVLNFEPVHYGVPGCSLPPKEGVPVIRRAPVPVEQKPPFYMGVRTNMLYDVALIPNIGVEFSIGRGWTIGVDWMYSWWKLERQNYFWRTYGGDLYVRRYFGRASSAKPLTGHHIGLYGQMLTYDFELGGPGLLSDRWSWGGGIEYGYTLPVARRVNIDFSIGVGYLGGEVKRYEPLDGHYVWRSTSYRHWIGPTKGEISLVVLLGRGNINMDRTTDGERMRTALVEKAARNGVSVDLKLRPDRAERKAWRAEKKKDRKKDRQL